MGARTGLMWLRIETDGGLYECDNTSPVFIKYWKFLD
jgi:hypothetical protein